MGKAGTNEHLNRRCPKLYTLSSIDIESHVHEGKNHLS